MPKGDFSGREKRLFLPRVGLPVWSGRLFCFGGVMGDKITVPHILKMKQRGEKITCLTAYDYSFARILDEAGVEMLLVGDSLGCVVQGQPNTLAVTMDEMIYHTRLVARGRKRALLISDMPFLSYQTSREQALQNAGRFLKEAGAEAVKLEGGVTVRETIDVIVKAGIPVMGHVGLTPQSVHQFGGYKIQGREKDRRERVLSDALAVEEAGAFSIVLEGMPLELAKEITERLTIPTIGIGAGAHCDGQVLVIHDMLGLFDDFTPKFVKRYADLKNTVTGAAKEFIGEVKEKKFPTEEHSFR
jgi:3-methyl-2-oxobutanoate hydroxymethyltransferase